MCILYICTLCVYQVPYVYLMCVPSVCNFCVYIVYLILCLVVYLIEYPCPKLEHAHTRTLSYNLLIQYEET